MDVARALAIVLVALNHAVNRSYEVYVEQMKEFYSIPVMSSVFKAVCLVLSHLGVPLFLMISGALLLGKVYDNRQTVVRFYRHNLLDIFITSEIWYFIMYWGIVLFFDRSLKGNLLGCIIGCIKTMLFIDQNTMGSMWYIPMILCIYIMIPLIAVAIQQFGVRIVFLPCLIVYISSCIIPFFNDVLTITTGKGFEFSIKSSNVFSFYFIYVIAGWIIQSRYLEKVKTGCLWATAALLFVLSSAVQLWAFRTEADLVFSYEFPLFLPISIALFEIIRRKAGKDVPVQQKGYSAVTYISKISFAIFFIHVCIMTFVDKFVSFEGWMRPLKCLFLLISSMILSVIVIWILSHVKVFRRYMLFMKDRPASAGKLKP